MKLIDALEENDDVQAVHGNFDVDDAVLERVASAGSTARRVGANPSRPRLIGVGIQPGARGAAAPPHHRIWTNPSSLMWRGDRDAASRVVARGIEGDNGVAHLAARQKGIVSGEQAEMLWPGAAGSRGSGAPWPVVPTPPRRNPARNGSAHLPGPGAGCHAQMVARGGGRRAQLLWLHQCSSGSRGGPRHRARGPKPRAPRRREAGLPAGSRAWPDPVARRHPADERPNTLFELAASLTAEELETACAIALHGRTVSRTQLTERLERSPPRAGLRALRRAAQAPVLTRSEYERMLRRLVTQAELPQPTYNALVLGKELDLYWPRPGWGSRSTPSGRTGGAPRSRTIARSTPTWPRRTSTSGASPAGGSRGRPTRSWPGSPRC